MSALTKIFVVLSVILSLLLSAGVIVFVNRQENFRLLNEDLKKHVAEAQSDASTANAELQKTKDQLSAGLADRDTQIAALRGDIANRDKMIADRDTQNNELQQQVTQANAASVSSNEALKVAQQSIAAQQAAYAALQGENDKRQKQNVDDSNRITELTNALEVTTKHDRYMAEQNTQLSTELASANELLRKYNINPTATPPSSGALNPVPAVNINGIVRDFRTIQGVPYATISLGSAEQVTRGMRFTVIDPTRNLFLGYLTIDTVQAHESTGRLDGPAVSQVRPNVSEVRTQL